MSEKLGRYLLGVVPIKNAASTEPDTYWQDKKESLGGPPKSKPKLCAICGNGRIPHVAQLKWKPEYQVWVHNPCLEANRALAL